VTAGSLFISVWVLFGMLLAVVITIAAYNWKMTKSMGGVMFFLYLVFVAQVRVVPYDSLSLSHVTLSVGGEEPIYNTVRN
jgi:hypothetical protein